jgi:multiple sugar transport system substrate-binding protein
VKNPTEIIFWSNFNDAYNADITSAIESFKTLEPNVTVTLVKQTGNYDNIKDMVVQGLPANNYPDMFVGYPDSVCEVMNYNKVVQLDKYIDNADYGWSTEDKADMVKNYLDEGKSYPVEGTWSLPFAKSTEAMFYNQNVIGIDLKSIDATINGGNAITAEYLNSLTWEDLFDHLCPALVTYNNALADKDKILKSDQASHAVVGYDSDDNLFITLAQQYGYGYTSVNTTTGVGSLDFVNDGMKGLMKTFNKATKDGYFHTSGSTGVRINTLFTKSNFLFSIGSTGGTKYQKSDTFNVGVAKIPHAAGKDAAVINQGPSICVLDHASEDRALASWLFYKYFTNKTNNTKWSLDTNYMPVRYSVYETEDYADACSTEDKADKSVELLFAKTNTYDGTISNDLFLSPVFKGSATARSEVGGLLTKCLQSQSTDLTDAAINDLFTTAYNNTKLKM